MELKVVVKTDVNYDNRKARKGLAFERDAGNGKELKIFRGHYTVT